MNKLDPGALVDQRFRLEAEIPGGGMGRIFRATDEQSGQPVAFKLANANYGGLAARFRRESVLLAEIDHPGIVAYVAHGDLVDGTPYLVMEWLDGVDLADHLAGGGDPVPEPPTVKQRPGELAASGADPGATTLVGSTGLGLDEVVILGRRIASALGALHDRGLVHRDVKPANIHLVNGEIARAKLLDFGTARETAPLKPLTADGVLVGTPHYMAPEQARGSTDIGPPTDVWALGCVLYQCVCGRPPFAAPHPLAALARIVVDEPTAVERMRAEVPADLAAVIGRALAKQPGERFADGRALHDAIAELAPISPARTLAMAEQPQARTDSAAWQRLTTIETRVCSLLFVRGEGHDPAELERLVIGHGGTFQPLADGSGSILVTLEKIGAPKDQAAAAAQIALALRARQPALRQVLATGRGRDGGHSPMGSVVDSAVSALLAAPSGVIRVDKLTASLIDARFVIEHRDDQFQLVAERAAEAARTLLGKPSRWVGRRRELGSLTAIYEECIEEGVARAVLVSAPAGIGKSRLRYETVRELLRGDDPPTVLYGQGDSLSAGSPFVMIAPAIRRLAGILDGEPLAVRREKLERRIAAHVDCNDRQRIAVFIGELIGADYDDRDNESLRAARADKLLLAQLMREAFVDWLAAECRDRPVLVVLEDLHWGDRPSVDFLDAALRRLADEPLMVLALARPEIHDVFPRLWENRELEEIRLHALSPRACTRLAREALGDRASDEMIERIVARCEGNAFFLEELIRSVAEGAGASLPDTVIGMVQARLDGLDLEARRILRAASVFGELFWDGGVRALLGEAGDSFDVGEWLDDLARREVITRHQTARLPDQREYKFRHALVRDAAYEMLTDQDREVGHLLAGTWLAEAGERDGLVLASHFERGGDSERAIHWLTRAAVQALEGNDLAGVVDRAERAVAAGASGAVLGELRCLQATAAYWQSDYAGGLRFGCEALTCAAEGNADWFVAAGSAIVSAARLGDYDSVDRLFDRALAAACRDGAEAAQLICLCRGTFQLIFAGRFTRADQILARIAELADAAPEIDALTYAQVNHVQGVRAAHIGDVRTFLFHLERAVDGFERAGDSRNVSLERTTVAWCWAELGRFEHAEALCRDNLDYCERQRAQQAMTYGKVNLGYILTGCTSKLEEARRVLSSAVDDCRAVGNPRLEGWARAHLTTVENLAGNHAAEEEHARTAAELLGVSPGLQSWALATWSRALLALGRTDEALDKARQSMSLLEELGGLLQGESLPPLVLAEALLASGDRDAATAAAADARARLQRRADRLRDPDWIDSFLAIRENARTLELAAELVG